MTNKERLAYAENKLIEACENGTVGDCRYWAGYRDGVKRCVENCEHIEDLSDGALD